MVIAAILFGCLIARLLLASRDREEKQALILRFTIILLILVSALVLLQYELSVQGFTDGTCGSDSAYYYEASLKIANGEIPISQAYLQYSAPGYCIWGALIEATSFCSSVMWIKLCNILIFLYLLLSLYVILRKNGISAQISLLAISAVSISGILIWCTIRNLKDIPVAFLMVESILLWENYSRSRRGMYQKAKLLLILGVIILVLSTLREFAIPIVLAISMYYIYSIARGGMRKFAAILVAAVILGVVFVGMYPPKMISQAYTRYTQSRIEQLQSERPQVVAISSTSPAAAIAMGIVRVTVLPVPTKYLRLMDIDNPKCTAFTGFSNHFWKFEGCCLWWLLAPLIIMGLCTRKYWRNRGLVALGIVALSYVLVYGSMYIGSGDVRDRIPLYIFGIILSVVRMSDMGVKKFQVYYPLVGLPIFIIGVWWTFQ